MDDAADIAVVGAGAAGLMAATWAGRTNPRARIVALDGAKRLGAKILVAGGGRCNVTHFAVDETAYAGSSRHAIKKVLRRFDVVGTIEFFRALGVELKRESTGKLFPVTDDAHTVLDGLLRACGDSRVELLHPWRVERVDRAEHDFVVHRSEAASPTETTDPPPRAIRARRVILATGGMALPRSGSDGKGYEFARSLGHSTTPRIVPALVPLVLDAGSPLRELSGVSAFATLEVRASSGKRLESFTNSALCTHFGVSGPAVLDISRYLTHARFADPGARLVANWTPDLRPEQVDQALQSLQNRIPLRWMHDTLGLPDRLARTILSLAGVDPAIPGHQLTRERRRALVAMLTEMPLPVTGDRGFTHAEVTAGGVPLSEIRLETMESRLCPGLYLCGEILDVDGRIGGFNFQWAWASGFIAGAAAAESLGPSPTGD